jgi:hypothetical protein
MLGRTLSLGLCRHCVKAVPEGVKALAHVIEQKNVTVPIKWSSLGDII